MAVVSTNQRAAGSSPAKGGGGFDFGAALGGPFTGAVTGAIGDFFGGGTPTTDPQLAQVNQQAGIHPGGLDLGGAANAVGGALGAVGHALGMDGGPMPAEQLVNLFTGGGGSPKPAATGTKMPQPFGGPPTPTPTPDTTNTGNDNPAPFNLAQFIDPATAIWDKLGIKGADFSGVRGQMSANSAAAMAKITALQRAAEQQVASERPAMEKRYADAGTAIHDNANSASGMIQAGYDAARQSNQAGYKNLHIDDMGPSTADSQGAADQGWNNAQSRNIEQNYATSNGQNLENARTASTGFGDAASAVGQQSNNAVAAALASGLSNVDMQEQQQAAALSMAKGQGIKDLANQLYSGELQKYAQQISQQQFQQTEADKLLMNANSSNATLGAADLRSPKLNAELSIMQSMAPNYKNNPQGFIDWASKSFPDLFDANGKYIGSQVSVAPAMNPNAFVPQYTLPAPGQ